MTFRFLHASDLHLGKPFGGYPEGIRNRLREARHAAIGRLAQAARQGGAQVVLLAGDSFGRGNPGPRHPAPGPSRDGGGGRHPLDHAARQP